MAPPSEDAGADAPPRLVTDTALPALVGGRGPALVLLPGFALSSRTYAAVAAALAAHRRVVVPHVFETSWAAGRAPLLRRLFATLDALDVGPASFVGHSFGGAVALDAAAAAPQRVRELVLVDSDALTGRWTLARDAVLGARIRWLGTLAGAGDFAGTILRHPLALTRSALWGFWARHDDDVAAVRAAGIPTRLLWAERDTVPTEASGRALAERLGARFDVVRHAPGKPPVTHNWPYLQPGRFVAELLDGNDGR